jgi:hypothetical protein
LVARFGPDVWPEDTDDGWSVSRVSGPLFRRYAKQTRSVSFEHWWRRIR